MKQLLPATLLAFSICFSSAAQSADARTESPSATAKPSVVGQYTGEWKSGADASGALRIKLKQEGTTWAAEAMFTFERADVPTKMKSVEIEGTKVILVFDWEIQGTPGQSRISGELNGDTLQGTFETKSPEGPSKGTWKVTRS
jgi:hypothetical protein